ncbi:hypothetical protein [Streptomyces sp. SID13726]|uniref:hypothetical protein n=1 Tax=Streptomyces sp. SID13726 TaxID=2706058 RepID=UPI0013B70BA2|nr:hypothetical protein [Streptomyces sp. SID13726]NEB01932.1 hypothetical protein [Streptomyces sp. SID13726]
MHNAIDTITRHGDTILQVLAAFLIAFLTNSLTNRSRDRQDRAAELATLQAQVDAFITAAAAVRASTYISETVWEGRKERWRAIGVVVLGAVGGWATAGTQGVPEKLRYAAGMRDAAQLISRENHARKIALAALQAPMVQLGTAATPLMRHQDERLVQAVDEVMAAAGAIDDSARFERAMTDFGQAARTALQPSPLLWNRLLRRRTQ